MNLFELSQEDLRTGYYDPADDKLKTRHLTQTRKPRLMLKHLNKLKRMRALKKLENLKRQDLLGIMYGEPLMEPGLPGGGGLGPGPGF